MDNEEASTSTRRGILAAAAGAATGGMLLGAIRPAAAQTDPSLGRFAQDVGDGAAASYEVVHNLGTRDVLVAVFQNSDGAEVECEIDRPHESSVVVTFSGPAGTNEFRVVVVG